MEWENIKKTTTKKTTKKNIITLFFKKHFFLRNNYLNEWFSLVIKGEFTQKLAAHEHIYATNAILTDSGTHQAHNQSHIS